MAERSTLSYLKSEAAKNYPKMLNFVVALNKQSCMEDFSLPEIMVLTKCCHGRASHDWPKAKQLSDFVRNNFEDENHGWMSGKEDLVEKLASIDEDLARYIFYTILSYPNVEEKE